MSRVMLTTIQNRTCASAQFTDPKIKPSWKGKRFSFLQKKPDHADLWDEYVSLRQQAMSEGDEFGRKAHQFYLERRETMDAGAMVASPYSFDGRVLPDGSQLQISAIQRHYDFVADNGEEAALSELQNDPPAEAGPIESGITARRVQLQVSGWTARSCRRIAWPLFRPSTCERSRFILWSGLGGRTAPATPLTTASRKCAARHRGATRAWTRPFSGACLTSPSD